MTIADDLYMANVIAADIGDQLRRWRTGNRVSLRALADEWGTNPAHLSRIENGESLPGDISERLLDVLQRPESVRAGRSAPVQPNARTSDPVSSHVTVASLRDNVSTRHLVEDACYVLSTDPDGEAFTDTDILHLLADTGRPRDRNIIAKYRGWLEEDGIVVRVGVRHSERAGRELLHFEVVG